MAFSTRNWTTGYVVTAADMIDMETRLSAYTDTQSVHTVADAKGDLMVASGPNVLTRLPVGANGTVLTADSGTATGLTWQAATEPVIEANRMWLDMFRLANDGTPVFSNYAQTASRFKYVIMNVWERAHLASLRAQNANIVGLAYQEYIYDAPLVVAANGYHSDCRSAISQEEAEQGAYPQAANHTTGWYVLNAGAYVTNPAGSGRLLRLNLPAVQAMLPARMLARLDSGTTKWDGAFGDDFNYNVPTMTDPYSSADTDWEWTLKALRPAALTTYSAFGARGKLWVPNLGNASEWEHIHVHGLMHGYLDEFWMRFNTGTWNTRWYRSILYAERAAAMGTTVFASTPGSTNTDWTSARSGLAAALIAADANDPSRIAYHFKGIDHTNERWTEEFGYQVGQPTGARAWTGTTADSGLIRYFADGVAVLNPATNPSSPHGNGAARGQITVSLTGGNYTGSGRTSVNSVTLAAGEGAVLTRD